MKQLGEMTAFPALLNEGSSERAIIRDQIDFLRFVWDMPAMQGRKLFGNLCFRRKGSSAMTDKFIVLQEDAEIEALLWRYGRHRYDQYFSPNLYKQKRRMLNYVCNTSLGWCDVDEADPFAFFPKPSVVWQTSPGRTQALWFWDQLYKPTRASAFSKALAYRHGGDRGGSAANKLLRLPGSLNHKPGYGQPFISLLHFDPRPVTARPRLLTGNDGNREADAQILDMNPHAHDASTVFKKYRLKLDPSTRHLIRHKRVQAPDRSGRIYAVIAGLYEAGATLDEIASVIWASPYFRDKYGEDIRALNTEVSRITLKIGVKQ